MLFRSRLSNIVLTNVDDSALVYLHDPNPGWANEADCGTYTCTGLNNGLLVDVDGSFAGGASIVHDTAGIASGNCVREEDWNAYRCANAYKLLMFENNDADRFSRRVSPVMVTSDADDSAGVLAYSNTLNTMMDHGWDFDYTSLLRLGRFPAVVEANRVYTVDLTDRKSGV